jgi:hypothetical protein
MPESQQPDAKATRQRITSLTNITRSNIRIHNVTFPVFITQTYIDQGSAGTADRPNNSSVELRNFTFANITGDINSDNPGDGSCRTNVSKVS